MTENKQMLLEKQVVGGLFVRPSEIDQTMRIVEPEDFVTPARSLFAALINMRKRGFKTFKPNDVLAFCDVDADFIASCAELMPTHLAPVAEAIRDASLRRQAAEALGSARGAVLGSADDVGSVLSTTANELDALRRRSSTLEVADMSKTLDNVFRKSAQAKTGERRPVGLGRAFADITERITGLMNGRLYILAGRPGEGKTAVALHWAFFGAKRPLFVTSEMTEEDLCTRLLSHLSGVPQPDIESGRLSDNDWDLLEAAREKILRSNFAVMASHGKSADSVSAAVSGMHRHMNYDLVVHDYLQLFKTSPRQSRFEAVGDASKTMMVLAKRLDIPVLQLAQLNRELERRDNPEPQLSDLRDSGEIEQDADGIFFLFRPANYANKRVPMADEPDALLVKMAKNRAGPRGKWYVRTNFSTYSFSPWRDSP